MKARVVYVDGNDWVGLYVDGELVEEGHSIAIRGILDAVDPDAVCVYLDSKQEEILIADSRFPDKLEEFQKKYE